MTMVLLSPKGESQIEGASLAPRRFASLDGARVGLVISGKHNSDRLLEAIGELLAERYSLQSVERYFKPVATRLTPGPMMDEIVDHCDVVVHAIGDCGACSAASVADGIALEKRGVQAAVFVTDGFTASANSMARRHGFPGYHYGLVPHPLSSLSPEQVKARAAELLPEVLNILGVSEEGLVPEAALAR